MSWAGRKVTTARSHWRARLPLPCWRCKRPVTPDQSWHVEHMTDRVDGGPEGIENQWVSHAWCNTSAGGKRGSKRTNANREPRASRRIEARPLAW